MALDMRVNLTNMGMAQYSNMFANSACRYRGESLFANSEGVFKLGEYGGEDETDVIGNTELILSWVEFPMSDFGDPGLKRAREVEIQCLSKGSVTFEVTARGGEEETRRVYTAEPKSPTSIKTISQPMGSGLVGTTFQIVLKSESYMLLQRVDFVFSPLSAARQFRR